MEDDEKFSPELEIQRLNLIINDLQKQLSACLHKNDLLYEELLKYQLLHQNEEKSLTSNDTWRSSTQLPHTLVSSDETNRSDWLTKRAHDVVVRNSIERQNLEPVVMKMNVDHLLIPKIDIQLKERVGKGSFGEVW